MARRTRAATVVLLLAALLLPANGTAAPTTPDRLGARPAAAAANAPALGRPCLNGRARCGHIQRPLDPAKPKAGRLRIGYELYPRLDRTSRSLGTIVAVEGGPGYSTTSSRAYYRELFRPLLGRRSLLLVDNRGTGTSGAIRCPWLQSYRGNRNRAIGACGRRLGNTSDLYGSAFAVDDLAAVLDKLGIGRIDLYGDSYGTFFSQTFALRHPARLRTLILDGTYFVGGTDPWYSDTNRALRHAFTVACARSPACARQPGRPMQRIAHLTRFLRHHPIVGRAPDADGLVRRVRVNVSRLIDIVNAAATTPTVYRELDAAIRAALAPRPYLRPLLRLARETTYVGGAGPAAEYSEGLYVAVACNDYPQPYDVTDPVARRYHQFHRAIGALKRQQPRLFAPFGTREWVKSPYGYYDDCLRWPRPSRWVHPVPRHPTYPDVPTLVLNGDLDSLTSPEGGRATARAFPNSTFVETANSVHISALIDFNQCASVLVRRFVRHREAGDTSCAARYHENRLVGHFARRAHGTGWHGVRLRTARVAAATAADVLARWLSMYTTHGVGLRGGTFTVNGGLSFWRPDPVVVWKLRKVRWVRDVAVSGTMRWHRRSGLVTANVHVSGAGATPARLRLTWNDLEPLATATAVGTAGGRKVAFHFPAS